MKLQQLYKFMIPALVAGIISTGISSCNKVNDWEIDNSHNRLFRPSTLTAEIDGVTATLKWKNMPNTDAYVIELSKDSLQFSQIVKTYSGAASKSADGYYFVIPDLLDPQTQYSARIKGTDTIGIPESQWATVAFKSKTEQLMTSVADGDMTPKSVVLKWKAGSAVSHFMIGATRYDITADESAAGQKTISGLIPETQYSVSLYLSTSIRGSQQFTTPADLPVGPNVVIVKATDDLANMIYNAQNGTMFVLRKNTKYNCDTLVNIPNGVSFTIWGEAGGSKPILSYNGFNLQATAGTIRFENIDFTGYQDADPTKTKRNYIFNQSTANTTAEIIFENCIIRNLVNSPMRIQTATTTTVDKFTINKCLVYDIGDNNGSGTYAFIHAQAGKINNIAITNSTFYKIGYSIILHNSLPSQTVTIRNNTFNNVIGNTRYFIDYNAQAVSSSFVFENNIVGKTLSSAGSARGIRVGAGTVQTVINSYQTTDAVFAGNAIPNITPYNKTSTELFTDPNNGIFAIKDNGFAGKDNAGDPRWR